jgi:aminoglycoside phosphotransferase (APT) family kinase protein
MEIAQLVVHINERHQTQFILRNRYATGENQGAYALTTPTGDAYVLKWNNRPPWLRSIQRAQRITDFLGEYQAPVPRYVLADSFADGVTYWVQTALPGAPPERLRLNQLQQLLTFIDVQAGRALSNEANWSEYVLAVVFRGESGWRDSLEQYSAATRSVLERLTRLVANKQGIALREDDIVHGDLGPDNLLVVGDTVSGIVDWDATGCGDRSLDLSKLLLYAYDDPAIRAALWAHMVAMSGRDALDVYLAYNILAQLDWSIHHHTAAAVDRGVVGAHAILHDLETWHTAYTVSFPQSRLSPR